MTWPRTCASNAMGVAESPSVGPGEAVHRAHPRSQVRAILPDTELCSGCPGRCLQGKGWLLLLKPLVITQPTEADSNTRAPAGTGPATTQAGTSTVNALQLKSYFSKELVLSSFFPGCCGPSRRPHTSRGLSKRQPVGDVLWVSPQCPAPSRGGCQLCRAHGLHRAPDPTRGHELPPLAPCTHLPLPSPSGAAEKTPGQVWSAHPLGKWCGSPLLPHR